MNENYSFKIKPHQKTVENWFTENNKKLLLFHNIGSGKTCSSILAQKKLLELKKITHVYVVVPASTISNFQKELNGNCGINSEKEKIKIYSHDKFIKYVQKNKLKLKNSLIIIDEVHKIVSEVGTRYQTYLKKLNDPDLHIILLSGTPIYNDPYDICLILNLLSPKLFPDKTQFYKTYIKKNGTVKNKQLFINKIYPFVSSYKETNTNNYPDRTDIIENCFLDEFQLSKYKEIVKKKNTRFTSFNSAFYLKPRLASNLVYPDKTNKNQMYQDIKKHNNVKKYSTKFAKCIENIHNCKGTVFVFSNFVEQCGINDFAKILNALGYENYNINNKEKKIKYGIHKTNNDDENTKLIKIFNSKENENGKLCKILIGSPAMKEGINLLRCRQVHLLEPYWNNSGTEQILGRAIRLYSHRNMDKNKQNVTVFHYSIAIKNSKIFNIDKHIINIMKSKKKIINEFEKLLFKGSIEKDIIVKKIKPVSIKIKKTIQKNPVRKKTNKQINIINKNKLVEFEVHKELNEFYTNRIKRLEIELHELRKQI